MHLGYVVHERSGRVLVLVLAAVVLGISFTALVIWSVRLADIFDRLYGFLD